MEDDVICFLKILVQREENKKQRGIKSIKLIIKYIITPPLIAAVNIPPDISPAPISGKNIIGSI